MSKPNPVEIAASPSSSSPMPTSPAASPSPSAVPVSTIANAGKSNSYIWTKAKYFKASAEPVSRGAGVPAPSMLWSRVRMGLVALFLFNTGAGLTNFVVLPLQLIAFGYVVLRVILSRSSQGQNVASRSPLARWSPLALRAIELMTGLWLSLVSVLLERVMGMRVHMAGDIVPDELRGEGALILSNHPSTADWLYIFSWMVRQGDMMRLKIVLKGTLSSVPIVGWVLQCCRYLFLARDWQKDQSHMDAVVTHWAGFEQEPDQVQMLLFPEGTDLRPVSYDQSVAFVAKAQEKGTKLTPLQHLLQTRVTGFVHVVKLLRKTGSIKVVYDLTLGSSPVPVTIENLVSGIVPSDFHVFLRRYDLSTLPTGDEELAAWIQTKWIEKDQLLEGFYSAEPHAFPVSAKQQQLEVSCARRILFTHYSLLAGFGLIFLIHSYLLWQWPLIVLLMHAIMSGLWVTINRKYKGIDSLMYSVDRTYLAEQEQIANANKKKDK